MKIVYSKKALKAMSKIDKKLLNSIIQGINGLKNIPPIGDIKSLKGVLKGKYRLRISSYRIIFQIDGNIITIVDVVLRRDAY